MIKIIKSKKPTYEVGFGKPPKAHQFKPGTSGNPKGRPKAKPTLQELFARTAGQLVTVKQGEETIRITKAEASIRRLFQKAMEGDIGAIKLVLLATERGQADAAQGAADGNASLDLDDEALARMLARFDHLKPKKT